MDKSRLLWLDFRFVRDKVSYVHNLSDDWDVSRNSNIDSIDRDISEAGPILLCFEYDYPDIPGLSVLRQASCLFPSIPIIMLTEQHSEALAIWALRIRVWDYLVKPFPSSDLKTSAANILNQEVVQKDDAPQAYQRHNLLPNPFPPDVRLRHGQIKKTCLAQTFVEVHYHEKVCEDEVAQLCGMNASTFSRSFKSEHEITFRSYLINYRILKARQLLQNPRVMVTDIAYTVGFKDPSYFTRTFRRIVGMSPSSYHEAHKIL